MASTEFPNGVRLDYDDALFSVRAAPVGGARGGRRSAFADEAPAPIGPPAAEFSSAAGALAGRLKALGAVARVGPVIPIGAGPSAPGRRRAAPAPREATRLSVPVGPGEQAVVLVEGDGVLAWRYGQEAPASALAERRRDLPRAERLLVFDLGLPPIGAAEALPAGAQQRGWLRDRLVEGVKAIVLYFAAEVAASAAVKLLERKRRDGPVIIASAEDAGLWERPDNFSRVKLPADRPARVLLLVHGTFSSTLGGFGELTVTPWGRRLLTTARERYDAVLGFDHRTLALAPPENAQALLAALRSLRAEQGIVADAVCHSRGGLVLRSLIEQELPKAGLALRFERAVFVAATNRGTELARPENWETLVDLVTNLSSVSATALSLFAPATAAVQITDEAIGCIGDFVKYLVNVAVKERRAPGLAAMDPSGDFVREINRTQSGQPMPQDIACYAIVSDFYAKLFDSGEHEPKEMPKRLAFLLADGVVDRLMRGDRGEAVPNDLVVDVASMTDIDRAVGGYVRDVHDFGHNPLVYHTNYFVRPETVGRLAQWLRLPSPLGDAVTRALDGGVSRGVLSVPACSPVAAVRELIEREQPRYLVFEREHQAAGPRGKLYYAFTPQEFQAATAHAPGGAESAMALNLAESGASSASDAGHAPTDRRTPGASAATRGAPAAMPRQRGVVLAGQRVQSVLEADSQALDTLALARLAQAERYRQTPNAGAEPTQAPSSATRRSRGIVLPDANGDESDRSARSGSFRDLTHGPSARNWSGTRSRGARAPAPAPATRAKPARRVKPGPTQTFVTAEMPREVPQGRKALVSVALSAEQIEAAANMASAVGAAVLGPGQVTVHVVPRQGFDYVGDGSDCQRTIDPPAPKAPATLDFTLVARDIGPGEVMVAIRQGAQRLLTLTLHALVIEARSEPARGSATSSAAAPVGSQPECGLCATLEIFDRRGAGELRYEYILRAGGVNNRFFSDTIKADPQAYVAARYEEIEKAWTGSARAVERFRDRLQAMGGAMFRQLFPPALRQELWRLADAGQIDDILVYSDEPFLPWEVVFLDDPAKPAASGRGRFFGELGLCRWLYGAVPTCEIRIRKGGAHFVVPHYPDPQWQLVAAEEEEEPMLKTELGATAIEPSYRAVKAALSTPGSFDLLHFAGHGVADSADIDSAALLLEGELVGAGAQAQWAKESLLASVVNDVANLRGPDGNRPLVVINACQTGRLGHSLSQLGGFAPAFLGAREGEAEATGKAGAFVGALWSVGDFAASSFVSELYRQLKAGQPMGRAVVAGRKKAWDSGEGTWLAYTVYAHPNLKLLFE